MTGGLLWLMGYDGVQGMVATLGVAAIVCCAACTAGDVCNDLKTGALVGATPRRQQAMQLLGVVVAAHSTGGLITPLWLDRRRKAGRTAPIAGLVLDSPWFDLQGSAVLREVATPVVKLIGKAVGTRIVPVEAVGVYGQTIHADEHGEFDFDVRIKPIEGFPVRFGWLRAVRVAHSLLHRGLDVGVPSLVLRSTKSFAPKEWSEEAGRADVVLDTRQIAKWSGALGGRLTVVPVENAKHDVFLSEKDARENPDAE